MKVDKKYLSKSVNMWYYRGRIRIEPDWNVKKVAVNLYPSFIAIRIEPDWNVKMHRQLYNMGYLELE